MGIGPTWPAWKANSLPITPANREEPAKLKWAWAGRDSNPRRFNRQIYSLMPLAARPPARRSFSFTSYRRDLNPQPPVYKTGALPLSYGSAALLLRGKSEYRRSGTKMRCKPIFSPQPLQPLPAPVVGIARLRPCSEPGPPCDTRNGGRGFNPPIFTTGRLLPVQIHTALAANPIVEDPNMPVSAAWAGFGANSADVMPASPRWMFPPGSGSALRVFP